MAARFAFGESDRHRAFRAHFWKAEGAARSGQSPSYKAISENMHFSPEKSLNSKCEPLRFLQG